MFKHRDQLKDQATSSKQNRSIEPDTFFKRFAPHLVVLGFLLLWQIIGMLIAKPYILPTPIQVLEGIWRLKGILFAVHLPATVGITGIGLILSILLGLILAICMDRRVTVERAVYPLVIGSQTIPTTAIAPLFVLWFGYGIWSKVLVTVLMTFFPIVINVHEGLKSVKREQVEYFMTCNARQIDVFLKLKVPTALPYFFSALKMAIPLSLIGAAIAEWLGGQKGLGYLSKRMITQLDGAGVFAPVVVLSVVAIILVQVIQLIEHRLLTWRREL